LSEEEKTALVAFIRDGLYDPNLDRFVPEEVLSGNCFPNNDPLSREQLGCD
jgi:cytochrome c peroxidase